METEKLKTDNFTGRLFQLHEKFVLLEPKIEDQHIKKALSVLNGMIQEVWRNSNTGSADLSERTAAEIANLYKNAPKMEGPATNTPLPAGTAAPDFALNDAAGKLHKLSDYRGSTVLLVFYPLDWSPGCSQQLDLYQMEWEEFEKRSVKVIGISVDSIYSHGAWSAVRNVKFPLLSDFNPKGEVAKKYGVFREQDGFSERALYIIDKEGYIQHGHVSPFIHHIPDTYELFKRLDEVSNKLVTTI